MIKAMGIALTGLQAATKQLNAGASNIANSQTAGSLEDGGQAPFTPLTTRQTAQTDENGNGIGVQSEIVPRQNPFVPAFDPNSPFADENGVIGVPNVDLAQEAVQLNLAELTYKANINALKTAEEMTDTLLSTFDEEA